MSPEFCSRPLVPRLAAFALLFIFTSNCLGQIRDGGIDPKNLGKGDWIYILSSAVNQMGGNVPGVTNLASLMAYQKNLGMEYLIIKAADGHVRFPSEINAQFTAAVVDAGHAAGLKIFGYNRSFGTNIPGEIAIVNEVFNLGADGFVIDAEAEWKSAALPNNMIIATNFLSALRTNWPNKFIAHSPFAFISLHGSFPYKEFGYYCDVAMPQDYWIEFGMTATATVNKMSLDWRNWQNSLTGKWTNSIKPIVPAGQGWSSASGTITAAQITEFVNALKNDPNPATAGGYKGVNYWRADLHPPDVLAAMRTNTIGNAPTNPPVVTNISSTVTDTSATIIWTTDQSSDSVVEYGLTTGYGSAVTNSTMLYYHTVTVDGLSPNTTYHFRAKSRNATNQIGFSTDYVFTTLAAAVPDLIIDDGNVNYGGSWSVGASPGFSGTEYRFASTAAGGASTATFRPNIAVAGAYDVFIWYISGSNRATNAPWTISYEGGSITQSVNQTANPGGWFKIADARPFAAGTNGYVRLSNNTGASGRVVIADAVRLVYVPPPPSGPSIATQPQNQAVTQGNAAMFTVVASGTAPLSYQWRRSGTNLAGATLSQYTVNNAQPADAGVYSVFISNSVSSVLSSNAILTVNVPPAIDQQPQSVTTNLGGDVVFAVTATGTAPLLYQWRFNESPIPGATGSSYTRTNVQAGDAGSYSVVVTNLAGFVISDPAVLSFLAENPPNIDSITLLSSRDIQLQFSGGPGNFALEVSPNLSSFTQLTTLNATGAVFQYTDSETNLDSRFYRLKRTQ